ncbi:MAG: hypothetical protein ACXACF_00830 [Candidatus Hermodarchaeia archaeon]
MLAETILIPWFTGSINPSNTLLYVSAVAPETFQDNPQLLQELAKHPLEFPDAMGKRRASSRYGTCLIAHTLNQLKPDPPIFIELLHDFDFFLNPEIILDKTVPEILQPQLRHFVQTGFDPTPTWQQELRVLPQYFHEGLHILGTFFKTRRRKLSSPKIHSYFTRRRPEQEWWGTSYHLDANALNILPPFLFIPMLAKSLILREAVRFFLPVSFQNAFDGQEFANLLVEKILNETEARLWSQIKWGNVQLSADQLQLISSISSLTTTLIEEKRLPQLYDQLKAFDKTFETAPTGSLVTIAKQIV